MRSTLHALPQLWLIEIVSVCYDTSTQASFVLVCRTMSGLDYPAGHGTHRVLDLMEPAAGHKDGFAGALVDDDGVGLGEARELGGVH